MTPVLHTEKSTHRSSVTQFCCALALVCVAAVISSTSRAEALDAAVAEDAFLGKIAEALSAYSIDVTTNLNARDVIRQRIGQPRVGRFPDLPTDTLPDSTEILNWEQEFQDGYLGGLALLGPSDQSDAKEEITVEQWLDAASRIFVTFYIDDLPAIGKIQQVVDAYGFANRLFTEVAALETAGEFYSTAAQRLAVDSREARRYDSAVTELAYLGERVRRGGNSLFKSVADAGNNRRVRDEPAIFLKETLGDEFTQSTIREIVVPGGVALGESARLAINPAAMTFQEGRLLLVDSARQSWELPEIDPATLKALFDFVTRSELIRSDAIVDIDAEGRVKIADDLRDTDAGFAIMAADTQPFTFVRNLPVTKSVIIDTAVDWQLQASGNALQFATEFEVRFLSADNMRIAQTRAALEYEYVSTTGSVRYIDSWGREAGRLHENFDYAGLGSSVGVVAYYAGWIALFRTLHESQVPFLHGRYAFMKLDKTGRSTPARY